MKKQVRYGVFETNSSSTHSVAVPKLRSAGDNYDRYSLEDYLEDDAIVMKFGEFGWEERSYRDACDKLQYALTMVVETECRNGKVGSLEDFYELPGFKLINDAVKEETGHEVRMDEEISVHTSTYGNSTYAYTDHNGYIDHQSSVDDYGCLQDFLDYYDMTIRDFIFNKDILLITDNDNH